jgi:hypothetical protein
MIKRAAATLLWFLAGWTAASWIAFAAGIDGVPTAIGGLLGVAFVWFAPAGIFWSSRTATNGVPRAAELAPSER